MAKRIVMREHSDYPKLYQAMALAAMEQLALAENYLNAMQFGPDDEYEPDPIAERMEKEQQKYNEDVADKVELLLKTAQEEEAHAKKRFHSERIPYIRTQTIRKLSQAFTYSVNLGKVLRDLHWAARRGKPTDMLSMELANIRKELMKVVVYSYEETQKRSPLGSDMSTPGDNPAWVECPECQRRVPEGTLAKHMMEEHV